MITEPAASVVCQDLAHSFGATRALDGATFTVQQGEVFGLLGPNGAGKTTTIRILATLLPPDEGTALVEGYDVRRQAMAVRLLLGYVPQQLSADGTLTGYENVCRLPMLDVETPPRGAVVAVAAATGLGRSVSGRLVGEDSVSVVLMTASFRWSDARMYTTSTSWMRARSSGSGWGERAQSRYASRLGHIQAYQTIRARSTLSTALVKK